MKYALVLLLITVSAASARELTLDQALRLAEEHSLALKEAEANRLAAEKAISAATAERFPTLSLDATAKYVDEVPALNITIPNMFQLSREFGTKESYQTDLRLTLPLYTGGRISSAIALARSGRDYRAAMASVERDQLMLHTRLDYLGLHRAIQQQRAAQAALRRAQITRDDIYASYISGIADSLDVLDAKLSITKALSVEKQAQINTEVQTIRLRSRLGLASGEPVTLTDTLPDPPEELWEPASVTTRPELEAAQSMVRLNEAAAGNEKSVLLPTLSAFGGYSYGKPNIDPFSDNWNDNFTVGAKLQWSFNLGGSAVSRIGRASSYVEAAKHNRENVAEAITRETDLAREQVKLAHEQYLSSREELQTKTTSCDLGQVQHLNGVLSSNRLLEIEAALTQAESSHVAAKVDFHIALNMFYYAIGDVILDKGVWYDETINLDDVITVPSPPNLLRKR